MVTADIDAEIRTLLRKLVVQRCRLGWNQRDLAERLGCAQSSVTAFENNFRRHPRVDTLLRYGHALGLTLVWAPAYDDGPKFLPHQ